MASPRHPIHRRPRMNIVQVFTPILEEPPEHSGGASSAPSPSPAANARTRSPPPLPPARPTTTAPIVQQRQQQQQQQQQQHQQQSSGGFYYFKDVVEAQARGDIEAASAAFKAINVKLGSLPRDSPEKAEIFAECGLHLLLEARRCKTSQQLDDARSKAQRAQECLDTAITLQQTLNLAVRIHHYLWLGWIFEFLSRRAEAHKAYENGINTAADPTDPVTLEVWMARIELYTEEQDWERCWTTLMAALTIWPQMPDLYARAGVVVLKKDFERSPIEALQGALFWYRAAAELAPSNTYYPLCIARVSEQLALTLHLPNPSLSEVAPNPCSPPPPPSNFLNMSSRTSLESTGTDYGEVLHPDQRQYTMGRGIMSPLPQASRPQSVGPMSQPFPARPTPQSPEAWQLPSPSLRSRSAVSSPGPSSQKPRRYSGTHRARGLLSKVHEAVKSIHQVARAVTPLKQRVSETQDALTQQYNHLHDRVDDLSQEQVTIARDISRRLSNAEANIEELKATRSSFEAEDYARRAQSVPPQRPNAANMSQDELLERSIMLYGVWALERRLAS